jgi:hypothetical protein
MARTGAGFGLSGAKDATGLPQAVRLQWTRWVWRAGGARAGVGNLGLVA